MEFRKSTPGDVEQMVRIAEDGKAFLRSRNVSQWQRGSYPDREILERDARAGIGHVVAEGERVLAICAVTFADEPSYRHLLRGAWKTPGDEGYATIHRCAVSAACRGKGIAGFLFEAVCRMAEREGARSVRVDTHPDNVAMRSALAKAGFERCGELRLVGGDEDGDLRFGYERLVGRGHGCGDEMS